MIVTEIIPALHAPKILRALLTPPIVPTSPACATSISMVTNVSHLLLPLVIHIAIA
jgi:hypothetical protein